MFNAPVIVRAAEESIGGIKAQLTVVVSAPSDSAFSVAAPSSSLIPTGKRRS